MADSELEFGIERQRWGFVVLATLLGLALLVIANVELPKGLAWEHDGVCEVARRDVGDESSAEAFGAASAYTYYFPVVFHNYHVPVWKALGLEGQNINVIALDPDLPGVLYAGTSDHGIYKSTDYGETWIQINNGLWANANVLQIAIDPYISQTVYACALGSGYFFRSEDGGESWQPGGSLPFVPLVLEAHPAVAGRLLVGDLSLDWAGGRVYKSDDAGLTWTTVITERVIGRSIATSVLDQSPVYVGAYYGLYRSEDGGSVWTHLISGLPDAPILDVALHPTDALTAYVSTDVGTFKTDDGGDSWWSWGVGLPSQGIYNLLIDEYDPNIQYATSGSVGVYVSRDEGRYWHPMNAGLGNQGVRDLVLDQGSSRLYAATADGVWVLDLTVGEQ